MTTSGIGKYRLEGGLSMRFRGTSYVVLAYFQAPNDIVRCGNPLEMTLAWCPTVPEDGLQSSHALFRARVLFWRWSAHVLCVQPNASHAHLQFCNNVVCKLTCKTRRSVPRLVHTTSSQCARRVIV